MSRARGHGYIHVQKLGVADAQTIARLEARLHIDELRAGFENIENDLAQGEDDPENLNIGLFDRDELVGFILAYHQPDRRAIFSYFDFHSSDPGARDRECVYMWDIAVLPPYRRHGPMLFERFCAELRHRHPGLPMDGFSRRSIVELWFRRVGLLEASGYRLARVEPSGRHAGGEELFWVSAEPLGRQPDTAGPPGRARRVAGSPFAIELVTSEEAWTRLEPVWDRLLEHTPGHTVFQTFALQRLWWRRFGLSSELFIVVLRDGDEVAGIAPLRLSPVTVLGRWHRRLEFIGSHEEVDRPTFLFPAERRAACLAALVAFLKAERGRWDLIQLHEQPPEGDVRTGFQAAFGRGGFRVGVSAGPSCPFLRLTGSWPDYLATRSRGFRKQLRRKSRQLAALGRVELVRHDVPEEAAAAMQAYRALEARSWKAAADTGVGRDADSFGYYQELAREFAARGAFALHLLTLGGEPIAGTFGIAYRRRFYSLQIVHDRTFDRFLPGMLLTAFELEALHRSGTCEEYDFLGGFLNNKTSWTAAARPTIGLHVFGRGARLAIAHGWYFRLKPALKALLRALGLDRLERRLRTRPRGVSATEDW